MRSELEAQLANLPLPLTRLLKRHQPRLAGVRSARAVSASRRRVQRQQTEADRLGREGVQQLLDDYQSGMSIRRWLRDTAQATRVLKLLKDNGVATRPTGVNFMWVEEKHLR